MINVSYSQKVCNLKIVSVKFHKLIFLLFVYIVHSLMTDQYVQCVFVSTDCICGHHIYEELWVALVRECLPHQAETENINSSNETGPAKTWHICTNYTCSENGMFLGLCLWYSCAVNCLCFLIDLWIRRKDFIVIVFVIQKIL